MNSYVGVLNIEQQLQVKTLTKIRFKHAENYKTPEALILYEQGFLPEDIILKMCELEYEMHLECPRLTNVDAGIIASFKGSVFLPYRVDTMHNEIHCLVLPENFSEILPEYMGYTIVKHLTPIYYYVRIYNYLYGEPEFLAELAVKDLLNLLTTEGINIGASDLHIVPKDNEAEVFFKVRKKKVYSKRRIKKSDIEEIIKLIAVESKAAFDQSDKSPKYMALSLDLHHRGRVVVNSTYYGRKATIRILSNDIFNTNLEELHLDGRTIDFIRKYYESDEKGLRLIVGPTSSGKNTTLAAVLHEKNASNEYIITSIENPIEIFLEHVEQIQADSEDEFIANAESLIRSDPDIIYLSEFTERSAKSIMKVVNTAKPVFSSIHANSIAGIISRIQDLTGLSYDRIIEQMHSVIFQELVRDDAKDKLFPVTHVMYFTKELKRSAYGKTYGEIVSILDDEEQRWKTCEI